MFFVFPIAFTLNRLGQHYDIDPGDPAKWGTLMRGHWFWDFAFLYSNYHLEHHYFPGVPFYRLPALQRALLPFYDRHGMRWQNYPGCSTAGWSRTARRTPTGPRRAAAIRWGRWGQVGRAGPNAGPRSNRRRAVCLKHVARFISTAAFVRRYRRRC